MIDRPRSLPCWVWAAAAAARCLGGRAAIAVVESIARGDVRWGSALTHGVVPRHGAPEQVAAARRWLADAAPG